MPRESIILHDFSGGCNLAMNPDNMPLNTSPNSYNVEPPTRSSGQLAGMVESTTLVDPTNHDLTDGNIGYARGVGFLTRPDGTWDMIYREVFNNTLQMVPNWERLDNTITGEVLGSLPDPSGDILLDTPAFVEEANTLRIGRGPYEDSPTMWVGYKDSGSSTSNSSAKPQLAEDKCVLPTSVPFLHKTYSDGTYIYGISYGDDRIYKLNCSDGALALVSDYGLYAPLRSICRGPSGSIWALGHDPSSGSTYVYLVATSDLTKTATKTVTGITLTWPGLEVTDVLWQDYSTYGYLYIAATSQNGIAWQLNPTSYEWEGVSDQILWEHALANHTTGSAAFSDKSMNLICEARQSTSGDTGTAGHWYYLYIYTGWGSTPHNISIASFIPRYPFVDLTDGTNFGFIIKSGTWLWQNLQIGPHYCTSGLGLDGYDNWVPMLNRYFMFTCIRGSTKGYYPAVSRFNAGDATYEDRFLYYSHTSDGALYTSTGNYLLQAPLDSTAIPSTVGARYYFTSGAGSLASKYSLGSIALDGTDLLVMRSDKASTQSATVRAGISLTTVDKMNDTTPTWTNDDFVNHSSISLTGANGTAGRFIANKYYHYRFALEYDGFQSTPLSYIGYVHTAGSTGLSCNVTITITSMSTLNTRATALLLFKAYGNGSYTNLDTAYRLVERIPLDAANWPMNSTGNLSHTVVDDISDAGAMYEAMTGLPETISHTWVNWGSATSLNNYLFVASAYTPLVEDPQTYIFRSKPYRYSTFDWTTDFVKLNEPIRAIGQYAGRIYAFSWDRCYIVNPTSLRVEETVEGMGAMWHHSVITTEVGIFVAGEHHIYWSNGRDHVCVSGPIEEYAFYDNSGTYNWKDLRYGKRWTTAWGTSVMPVLLWEPIYSCLSVWYIDKAVLGGYGYFEAHLFEPRTKTWWPLRDVMQVCPTWVWSFGIRLEGSQLIPDDPSPPLQRILRIFENSSDSRMSYIWTTPELLPQGNHKSRIYDINIDYWSPTTALLAARYAIDWGAASGFASCTAVTTYSKYRIPTADVRTKSLMMQFEAASTRIQQVEIVKRDMVGLR